MKHVFIVILLLWSQTIFAQPNTTPTGSPNVTTRLLGGLSIDSAFKLPILPITNRYTKGIDTTARMLAATTDTLPRYMKKGVVVKMLTQFDSNKVDGYTTKRYVDSSTAAGGGGLAIGDPVADAYATGILSADASGNLFNNEQITYDGTNLNYNSYYAIDGIWNPTVVISESQIQLTSKEPIGNSTFLTLDGISITNSVSGLIFLVDITGINISNGAQAVEIPMTTKIPINIEGTIAVDFDFALGATRELHSISIFPAGAETIRVGTTIGGNELVPDTAITTAGATLVVNKILSLTLGTTIYVSGLTGSVTYRVIIL